MTSTPLNMSTPENTETTPLVGGSTESGGVNPGWVVSGFKILKFATVMVLSAIAVVEIIIIFGDNHSQLGTERVQRIEGTILLGYILLFTLLAIVTEWDCCTFPAISFLQSWLVRGQFYMFLGLLVADRLATGLSFTSLLLFTFSNVLVSIGLLYTVLGFCPCIQTTVNKKNIHYEAAKSFAGMGGIKIG